MLAPRLLLQLLASTSAIYYILLLFVAVVVDANENGGNYVIPTPTPTPSSSSSSSRTGLLILTGTVKPPGTNPTKPTTTMSLTTATTPATSTSLLPIPIRECNGYAELCGRGYGNVTYVGTHGSPFVRERNIAANQGLEVEEQLEDGVRMLQGQTRLLNDTLHFCHSSCDLLNTGTVEDYLTRVVTWLHANPHEILTILLTNGDWVDPALFLPPITSSGLLPLLYTPPTSPTGATIPYTQWPTLESLIKANTRVILFLDYKGDQSRFPMMLREFNHIWETKYSPTDPGFADCGVDRPPGLSESGDGGGGWGGGGWKERMYAVNHNLNVGFEVFGQEVMIPDKVNARKTNSGDVKVKGSLGGHVKRCVEQWGRPPSFLLVDFYDVGDGSVFEVAARANGVRYRRGCCSKKKDIEDGGGGKHKSTGLRRFGGANAAVAWVWTAVFLAGWVVGGGTGPAVERWGWGL
ncbi:PLC-like phosphodiesterase [Peziza echinospora]|nr:PLC-like phosphodiesterase [Peziza echinospora]